MNFVVDQQLPPALANWFADKGHQASHVYWIGLDQADDSDIWNFALVNGAIVVTKDSDFSQRRGQSNTGPQILWLRIGNTTTLELFRILENAWSEVEEDLKSASVVEVR